MQLFRQLYRLDALPRPTELDMFYVLIYGRRREIEASPQIQQEREDIRPPLAESMSFDRLRPIADGRWDMGVSVRGRQFIAQSIPPTLDSIDSSLAWEFNAVEGKAAAAPRSDYLELEGRERLAEMLEASDAYARGRGEREGREHRSSTDARRTV